ncbi:unnamed protein product [Mytilus coruscus]|uniref:Hexosyltransferase n=1 Tax=Mytilus coruscus TaxID=42192 RepID=A0A6J8D0X8_MYTCO|nr:unnamed protein product [Mytilus coruscus]
MWNCTNIRHFQHNTQQKNLRYKQKSHHFIKLSITPRTHPKTLFTAMRNTFGSFGEFVKTHIECVIMLGETVNDTQQMDIEEESVKYRDLIQGNFIDSYRNLTYKRVFSLFWANRFHNNVTYVIKIDDDITIYLPFLIPYLSNKLNKTKVLECFLLIGAISYRNPRDKWYMCSSDYPFSTSSLSSYCAGPSSIMSADVTNEMYEATKNVPFCWLEDV